MQTPAALALGFKILKQTFVHLQALLGRGMHTKTELGTHTTTYESCAHFPQWEPIFQGRF